MPDLSALRIDSPLSYLLAFGLPGLDAIVPVVPSETAVVTLGVTTADSSDPRIFVLVLLAAVGAFVGDNVAYVIGARFGPWVDRRFFKGERGARQRAWAERTLEHYGVRLIVVCRFIPGGRTAVTLVCGATHFSRPRFVAATAVAGVIWAAYAFFLGRLGGKAFEGKPWVGLLVALGVVAAVSLLVEAGRRLMRLRRAARRGSGGS